MLLERLWSLVIHWGKVGTLTGRVVAICEERERDREMKPREAALIIYDYTMRELYTFPVKGINHM